HGHVPLGQMKNPPHKSFAEIQQYGMLDHPVVPFVKRFMQRCRDDLHYILATWKKPFVSHNQAGADDAFSWMMAPQPKCKNVDKTCKKIAEVIQTFSELRFQVFGARNFAIAPIKNTERLENSRTNDDAGVIAAHEECACD